MGSIGNIVIKSCKVVAQSTNAAAIGYSTIDQDPHDKDANFDVNQKPGTFEMLVPGMCNDNIGTINVYGGNYSYFYPDSSKTDNYRLYHRYERDISDTTGSDAEDGDIGDPVDSLIKKESSGGSTGSSGGTSGGTNPPSTTVVTITKEVKEYLPGNPLIIHYGPRANQHLEIFINNMHTNAMGLKDVAVAPREKALAALEKLDAAVDYALNENTRMGAYQSRLHEITDNLTTESENVTSSESVIRDADMAKEMTAFVKDNVLAQASQSMLAQANQNSSSVLNLLQK